MALGMALFLGTLGGALTVVGVGPSGAANTGIPTITSVTGGGGPPTGGTKVTLVGTNMLTSTVSFGGAAGTVTSDSATKIVVTSPTSPLASPGYGTVNITVTNSFGPSTSTATFTYEAAPTVTDLYGGNAPTGGGTTIIIQGTNFIGATVVDFATTASTSFTVESSTEIQALVPAIGTETVGDVYNVTVTTGSGKSATATANQWYWFGTGSCTLQRHRGGEQRSATGGERLHPRRRRRHEYKPPLGRNGDPDGVYRSYGPGHDVADARVAGSAPGGQRHRDGAGRGRRQRGVARLVGRQRLLGHVDFDLQRPRTGVPAARVGAEHERWMPGLARLVRRCGVWGDAGVLRHRPRPRPAHHHRPRPTPGTSTAACRP